jgi:hypothetical protein
MPKRDDGDHKRGKFDENFSQRLNSGGQVPKPLYPRSARLWWSLRSAFVVHGYALGDSREMF